MQKIDLHVESELEFSKSKDETHNFVNFSGEQFEEDKRESLCFENRMIDLFQILYPLLRYRMTLIQVIP